MSNYLAIATVTATLNQLLNGIENDVVGVTITNQPPDVVITDTPRDILNIFLYHITQSTAYRNLDQPARSSDGSLIKKPQLGLNLHYMITAIAAGNDDLKAHQILSSGMRILHENPVLTRDLIRQTIQNIPSLSTSDLADQLEQIKITPQSISIEEITKLWSSFFQTNYRISATYEATIVILDSIYNSIQRLPVFAPRITNIVFRPPVIHKIVPQPPVIEYLSPTSTPSLSLIGQSFLTENIKVQIDDNYDNSIILIPLLSSISEKKVDIILPNALISGISTDVITPGIKTVRIVQDLNPIINPKDPTMHKGFESNIMPFIVVPKIDIQTPIHVARGDKLTLNFYPSILPKQKISFLFNDYEILIPQSDHQNPINQIKFTVPTTIPTQPGKNPPPFPSGNLLLRMRVDGVDSLLQIDHDENSSTYGQYISPIVTVT